MSLLMMSSDDALLKMIGWILKHLYVYYYVWFWVHFYLDSNTTTLVAQHTVLFQMSLSQVCDSSGWLNSLYAFWRRYKTWIPLQHFCTHLSTHTDTCKMLICKMMQTIFLKKTSLQNWMSFLEGFKWMRITAPASVLKLKSEHPG